MRHQVASLHPVLQASVKREGNDTPHEEQKKRKNKVRKGAAIPRCMLQRRPNVAPITRIIDQNHDYNGYPAQDIEGEDTGRVRGLRGPRTML